MVRVLCYGPRGPGSILSCILRLNFLSEKNFLTGLKPHAVSLFKASVYEYVLIATDLWPNEFKKTFTEMHNVISTIGLQFHVQGIFFPFFLISEPRLPWLTATSSTDLSKA